MPDISNIIQRINDTAQEPPSGAEILELLESQPYLSAVAEAWLQRTASDQRYSNEEERNLIAFHAAMASPGDLQAQAFRYQDLANGFATDDTFYPAEQPKEAPATEDAIDKFLDTYSPGTDNDRESEVIDKLIFNPVADYSAVLEAEEQNSAPNVDEVEPGSPDELINRFIIASKESDNGNNTPHDNGAKDTVVPPSPVPSAEKIKRSTGNNEDSPLSESLAKIYLRRKNYAAAYEIINKLNLNYPEKNIYFAVQLRFLKKLMLNDELISKAKTS